MLSGIGSLMARVPIMAWVALWMIGAAGLITAAGERLAIAEPSHQAMQPVAVSFDKLRPPNQSVLDHIKEAGTLVVLTRNTPTAYYIDRDTAAGFDHDLVQAFAQSLGVKAEIKVLESEEAVLAAMAEGEGHIAAAGIVQSPVHSARTFGPAYRQVRQQLVCHRDGSFPRTPGERTAGGTIVITEPSYKARLETISAKAPHLNWSSINHHGTEDLLERVSEGLLDCTVGESSRVAIHRRYHPELVVPFDLTGPEGVAWMLMDDAPDLQEAVDAWFAQLGTNRLLAQLTERYFGHVAEYDYLDIAVFQRRMTSRLPRYRKLFEQAAEETGLPWTLLAAIGYQESHWAPKARSHTGVRGLMMLTNAAASEVGVTNRLDPEESIMGGARYLSAVKERLPESVEGEDRVWLALAAYNVGLGHLYDARRLAVRDDRDPDRWAELKVMLPRLSQPVYYKTLKYGYARGNEPVDYVRRVRHYQDMLEREFSPDI